jgi:hypothetical protein
MGRSPEKIGIVVYVEPSEHPEDDEFLRDLKQRVLLAVEETRDEWPSYFIDTMGLD